VGRGVRGFEVYPSITASPRSRRAARRLCARQASLTPSDVDVPPSASGGTWSYCRYRVQPQSSAGGEAELALAAVAKVDGAPHGRGDVGRVRRLARLARPIDETVPLRGPGEEKVQPGLEEFLFGGARVRVGERVRGGRELREEGLRDGEMEPAIFGVERDDLRAATSGPPDFTRSEFNRRTRIGLAARCRRGGSERQGRRSRVRAAGRRHLPRRRTRGGHDRPGRRGGMRLQLGHDHHRIAARHPEEPRQDGLAVLGGEDLRGLHDGRET
jgi:hypothetical protein